MCTATILERGVRVGGASSWKLNLELGNSIFQLQLECINFPTSPSTEVTEVNVREGIEFLRWASSQHSQLSSQPLSTVQTPVGVKHLGISPFRSEEASSDDSRNVFTNQKEVQLPSFQVLKTDH